MELFKKSLLFVFLLPFSLIYGLITGIRNSLFNLNILPSHSFNTPTICVGNITVGGTGKTPHSEFLIKKLQEEYRIAYLSRGYKRKTSGFVLAGEKSDSNEIGDEAMQIKNKFPNITVVVDANRRHGIKKLESLEEPPELIILDDAFQHRYVKASITILLTDFNRPFYCDFLMPAGRLRETRHAKDRAQIVIVTKCKDNITPLDKRLISKNIRLRPFQSLFFTAMTYGEITPVFNDVEDLERNDRSHFSCFVLTGIANPKPLYRKLDKIFRELVPLKFPDHHNFSKADLENIIKQFREHSDTRKCIITTEKDAMRLRTMEIPNDVKSKLFYIPIETDFIDSDEDKLLNKIREYVTNNKGLYLLH